MCFVAPAVLTALLSYALTPGARLLAIRVGAVDHPGPRKFIRPRRRGSAVSVLSAERVRGMSWFGGPKMHTLAPELLFAVAAGLVPVAVISLIDDIRPQRAIVKFATHLIGATIAVALGIRLNPDIHFLGQDLDRLAGDPDLHPLARRNHERVQSHRRTRWSVGRSRADLGDQPRGGLDRRAPLRDGRRRSIRLAARSWGFFRSTSIRRRSTSVTPGPRRSASFSAR